MSLKVYRRKRDFNKTLEPPGGPNHKGGGTLRFFVQLHKASHLHFDLRLEMNGVLKSWALPKGPTLSPSDQKLAVFVEDHPIEYGNFEGIIPKGNYGAGTVCLWDYGTYEERSSADPSEGETRMLSGLEKGHMTFILHGHKLRGEFALLRTKRGKTWILVKKRDEFAQTRYELDSISCHTGRTLQQIEKQAVRDNAIWRRPRPIKPVKVPQVITASGKTRRGPCKFLALKKPKRYRSFFSDNSWIYNTPPPGKRRLLVSRKGKGTLYNSKGRSVGRLELKTQRSFTADGYWNAETFVALDLLNWEGESLVNLPLKERLKKLKTHLSRVLTIAAKAKADEKKKLFARYLLAPYKAGVQTDWILFDIPPEESQSEERFLPELTPSIPQSRSRRLAEGLTVTRLDKVLFPDENLTKNDLILYYQKVAPTLLKYVKDYPQSLHRFPNGIYADHFFQKDFIGYAPRFTKTHRVYSKSQKKTIDYLLCQNQETLLYMANLGCIEINSWLSTYRKPENPSYCLIDLDPDGNSFQDVVKVARAYHDIFNELGIESLIKTSGATGMHICIPLARHSYTYEQTRQFAILCSKIVEKRFPLLTSTIRTPSRRRRRIYLDCLQNRAGQTLVAPYSLRPLQGAPVSTPLKWSELNSKLNPGRFHIGNTIRRLSRIGDLWEPMQTTHVNLHLAQKRLVKLSQSGQA